MRAYSTGGLALAGSRASYRGWAAALLLLLAAVLAGCSASAPAALPTTTSRPHDTVPAGSGFGSNWTAYDGGPQQEGVDTAGTRLLPLHRAWTSPQLDGELFGEPLVEDGRIVVATENDTVYMLAADDGHVLWSRHLATPMPSREACGDIKPIVGITDTPVIDVARREILVEANELVDGHPSHHLYGLSLANGRVELDEAVDPPGSDPALQLQRPALALDGDEVVIGFGGYTKLCGDYHGFVVAVPEDGGPLRVFETDAAHGERQGSIWLGGAAPVVDAAGNVWVATANGSVRSADEPYDDSEAVVELSPAMRLEQYFAPANWVSDNVQDLDLGSADPVFVDGLMVVSGKSHVAYLLRPSHLGGIGGQLAQVPVCNIYSNSDGGVAVDGSTVYLPCQLGLTALSVSASPPRLSVLWTTPTDAGGPAIVAGGLVWSVDLHGVLWGLDPSNGHEVVREVLGPVADHFPVPTVADGLLLTIGSNRVFAFAGPAGTPPAPGALPG